MNRIAIVLLLLLAFSCKSQDFKDMNIHTRIEMEKWLSQKLNEPCDLVEKSKVFETLTEQKVGSVSNKVLLKTVTYSNLALSFEADFIIGENDCIQHRMWLYSKKGTKKIDSLLVDYLGDSFGTISISSHVQITKKGVEIYLKEIEILSDFETSKTVERKKTILFVLDTNGFIRNKNKEDVIISDSGKLFSIDEYLSEFKSNYKFENKTSIPVANKHFSFVHIKRNDNHANQVLIFKNITKKYFSYMTSLEEFTSLDMKINAISIYDNGIYLDVINKNNLNTVCYFKYTKEETFCLEKIISKPINKVENIEYSKKDVCINVSKINTIVNK